MKLSLKFRLTRKLKRTCLYFGMGGYYEQKRELYNPNMSSIQLRIKWLIYMILGFSTENFYSYRLYEKNYKSGNEFVSLLKGKKIIAFFYEGSPRDIVENKSQFGIIFKDFTKREIISTWDADYDMFNSFVNRHNEAIIKPTRGSNGDGIYLIKKDDPDHPLKEIWNNIKDKEYVIEEVLIQDGLLKELNPSTLNTIRVNVFNSRQDVRILNACLRCGQGDAVTDNLHSGGAFCEIDIETGRVITDLVDLSNHTYKEHPISKIKMKGEIIPSWEEVIKVVKSASTYLPDTGYLSWDIAVIKNNDVAIVEGNTHGNFDIQQVPRMKGVRRMYERLIREYKRPVI